MAKELKLIRDGSFDDKKATGGSLRIPGPKLWIKLYTLEPPWRDDKRDVSCIPEGVYECEMLFSWRFGRKLYHVLGTPGRTNIMIHPGNYPWETEGCILVGRGRGTHPDQSTGVDWPAVWSSRQAVDMLERAMEKKPFTLQITGGVK